MMTSAMMNVILKNMTLTMDNVALLSLSQLFVQIVFAMQQTPDTLVLVRLRLSIFKSFSKPFCLKIGFVQGNGLATTSVKMTVTFNHGTLMMEIAVFQADFVGIAWTVLVMRMIWVISV